MKKILFMAVSAALLAIGCQKTEIKNEVLTPIGFNTQMAKLTKAPDAENAGQFDNLKEQGFRVWGLFATDNDLNYKLGASYLDHIKVTPVAASTPLTWNTPEDTYYWPGKNKELDIYAISSWEEDYNLLTEGNVVITYGENKLQINNFVVDADADNDLMVAGMIKQDQDDAKYVEPQFEHMLTKVVLKFKKSGDSDIHVVSAVTSDLGSKSTLTVNNVAPATIPTDEPVKYVPTYSWADATATATYSAQCKVETTNVTGVVGHDSMTEFDAVKLNADDFITFGSWLLLPQTDISEEYFDVEYIVDGTYILQRFNISVQELTKWDRSQQITYNVIISPDYITFEPEVKEWTEKDDNDVEYKEDYES